EPFVPLIAPRQEILSLRGIVMNRKKQIGCQRICSGRTGQKVPSFPSPHDTKNTAIAMSHKSSFDHPCQSEIECIFRDSARTDRTTGGRAMSNIEGNLKSRLVTAGYSCKWMYSCKDRSEPD